MFPTGWTYRDKITIDSTKVGTGPHTDFPVLLKDSNFLAALYANAKADGGDIRFSSDEAGTTQLPFEIVSFTPGSSLAEIWVKISSLASASDTDIYVWYGNSSASALANNDTYGRENVWRSEYKGVWHLQNTSYEDSTSNHNDLTAINTPVIGAGKISNAVDLEEGSSQALKVADNAGLSITGDFTYSAWVNFESVANGNSILTKYRNDTNNRSVLFYWDGSAYSLLLSSDGVNNQTALSYSNTPSTATWIMTHATYKASTTTAKIYTDATERASTGAAVASIFNGDADLAIGAYNTTTSPAEPFDGLIDEVRVYAGTLSAAWITTEYNNQNSPSTFATSTSSLRPPVAAVRVLTADTQFPTNIRKTAATLKGNINFSNTTLVSAGFVISANNPPNPATDTIVSATGQQGDFSADTVVPLTADTMYYYQAFVSDANGTVYGKIVSFRTASVAPLKHYYYKSFDTGVLKAIWTQEVISEPTFRTAINGGVGELVIRLARTFDDFGEDVDVKLNNKVECWVVDKDKTDGLLLYTGYISGYRPVIDGTTEYVEITVFGYMAELQRIILKDTSGNTTLTYNSQDPAVILKDVIDKYRALGGSINYSSTSIDLTNTTVSYTFNTNTVKECLDRIIELCPVGWYWRIDPDGVIYLKPKNALADHSFTLGLDVEKLETFRRIEDLVNKVLFTGAGNPALFRKYENTSSQQTYGLYEKKMVDQRVSVAATASTLANREINQKKDPEIRSTLTIIDNNGPQARGYNIENVKVGQTLRIKNLKTGTKSNSLWDVALWNVDVWDQTLATAAADIVQILSITYNPDSIVIEASSRLPQIAKRIEDVQRNLEVTQVINNPASPT